MDTFVSAVRIILVIYFVSLAIEWILSVILKKKVYDPLDAISGMSSGLSNNIKALLKLTFIIVSYEWMLNHFALIKMTATPVAFILCFILYDFAYYFRHRWAHEINFLWNRHLIHHSSEEFNLSAAMRQPVSGFVDIYFFLYIPVAMMGVPTAVVAVIAPLHRFAQFWYHTRLINRMGFLEYIIVTPAHHRVHHAINAEYIDKNYSAIFIIWDKLFGTFQDEIPDNPPVYGIKKAVASWNPFIINFLHLWQLIQDTWRTQKFSDKLKIWYKPTGWRPEDVKAKYPVEYVENAHEQVKYKTDCPPTLMWWMGIQIMLHIAVQFHFLALFSILQYYDLLLYGLFIGLSIFSYTSLMDRHWVSMPAEVIKTIFGFFILYQYEGWFLLNELWSLSTAVMVLYLAGSLIITAYYNYVKRPDESMAMAYSS